MNLKMLVGWLLAIGALVWLVIGLTGINIIETILGTGILSRLVYIIVGLAGLYKLGMLTGMVGKKK